jgi:hypothetical protein
MWIPAGTIYAGIAIAMLWFWLVPDWRHRAGGSQIALQ